MVCCCLGWVTIKSRKISQIDGGVLEFAATARRTSTFSSVASWIRIASGRLGLDAVAVRTNASSSLASSSKIPIEELGVLKQKSVCWGVRRQMSEPTMFYNWLT